MENFERVVPTDVENAIELLSKENVMVDIKSFSVEDKASVIREALKNDDLIDPLMIMNLVNLVKVYNTLEDCYFESPDIYVNSVEELLDLKLAISADLKQFAKRISIYFMSLFKSFSKTAFTATDEHAPLPKLYEIIFNGTDLLTLSGIFAKTPEISTNELVYIDNSYGILSMLIVKNANSIAMMNQLFECEEEVKQ